MKSKLKSGFTFIISMMLIFSTISIAFAAEREEAAISDNGITIQRWIGISTITKDFAVSGGYANPIIKGTTLSGQVDSVTVKVSLKKSSGASWVTIKTWNQDIATSLNKFTFNEQFAVSKGYSYKYSATVKSYKNDVLVDTATVNSSTIEY